MDEHKATNKEQGLYERGKEAAALLWHRWRERPEIEDLREPEFARGAMDEIIRLLAASPDVDKEIREYSEAAAEQLTTPSRTIYEVMQNADDLGATKLRISLRQSGIGELLFAHDGGPVELPDVIAMTLAFLSSKRGDAKSKGRFGIGLKTLNQLGSSLKVHCPPYHFEIRRGTLSTISPADSVKSVYESENAQTLISISLDGEFTVEDIRSWIHKIEASQLLFLESIRRVSLIGPRSGKEEWKVKLDAKSLDMRTIELRPGFSLEAKRVVFSDPDHKGQLWTRYTVEYPVPQGQKRKYKATDLTTPLSVAVSEGAQPGILSAGLPLDVPWSLPISLNAQFDPNLARTDLSEDKWNSWLIDRLGELIGGISLSRFREDTCNAWQSVPLTAEIAHTGSWTSQKILEITGKIHERLRSGVRLPIAGEALRLSEISYVGPPLSRFLSVADLHRLDATKIAMPKKLRDANSRWHLVLDDLGTSPRLDLTDALELLDLSDEELGDRPLRWFMTLADVAIAEGEKASLSARRSILAEDRSRHSPKGETLLVQNVEPESISFRLGLERRVHPEYLSDNSPKRVKEWIMESCSVSASEQPLAILEALSRRDPDYPLHIDDPSLVLLQDLLCEIDDRRGQPLASTIGAVITLDGFQFEEGKKVPCAVRPSFSYLPTTIAKDTGGWAVAAKSTEGLHWIDARYAEVLRSQQARQFSAKRFLTLLGAKAGPRIVPRPGLIFSRFDADVPKAQRDALKKLDDGYRVERLLGDYVAPDLEKVVANIVKEKLGDKRSQRSRALFDTLAREWDELSEHVEADAEYHYYNWKIAGRVPSTWIAMLASEPWLSSMAKTKVAPLGIAIDSAKTRLTRGNRKKEYVAELVEADSTKDLIKFLGVKGVPPVSELVLEITALKEKFEKEVEIKDVLPLYEALAALIPNERVSHVGDVPSQELTKLFEDRKLLLTERGWLPPSKVFRGRPIFKDRRTFVSEHRTLMSLWRFLRVRAPNVTDCLGVLEEVASEPGPPTESVKALLADTLREISKHTDNIKGSVKSRLAKLPLWTSKGWIADRPVYAVEDETLGEALGARVPLWKPEVTLRSLGELPAHLKVDVLTEADFSLSSKQDVWAADEQVLGTFSDAVAHLKTEIARAEPEMWSAIDWSALQSADLLWIETLQTETKVGRRKIKAPQSLFMDGRHRIYYADADELGKPQIGERLLVRFTSNAATDRLGYLWSYAWNMAKNFGEPDQMLELAYDSASDDEDFRRSFEMGGKNAKGKRLFSGAALEKLENERKRNREVLPKSRRLKNFEGATIAGVTIIEANNKLKEVKPRSRPLVAQPTALSPLKNSASRPSPIKEWSELEKEERGFEILAAALKKIDDSDLENFTALRGIGADSIDNLKRFFEMKVFAGDPTDEVRFEASEFERAVKEGRNYFLAVISGMEEGKDTKVRIFSDPIRTLPWCRHTRIRLGGILSQVSNSITIDIQG